MKSLTPELRGHLEKTVIEARRVSEEGARAALEALAVHHHEPYPHQTSGARRLRNRLRAHARQLGDIQDWSGKIALNNIVRECAYEHWHRMLFARFLAENGFLLEPESGVAVTLDECEDLAKDLATDRWTLASRFAQGMFPEIFRPEDPVLQVEMAPEHRAKLEGLLNSLGVEIFGAADALGWVYQFWQSQQKKEVNATDRKRGAEEIPAVTQLFTEDYMVLYLLHNTLGSWWAGKKLAERQELAEQAGGEEELRRAVSLPGVAWDYLRFVRVGETWQPAAGTFPGWPKQARDLHLLDPCMGSGHFLVAAHQVLTALRLEEEGISQREASDAVLKDNLFGLELDPRCSQIAAFALALTAWKTGGYRLLPPLNLACSGLSPGRQREDWIRVLERRGQAGQRFFFGQFYDLFSKASTIGSLINPARFLGSTQVRRDTLQALFDALGEALSVAEGEAPEDRELGVAAHGLVRAAQLLAARYHLVATNVPYLGRRKQDDILKEHLKTYYSLGKADLATAFVQRCLEFCAEGAAVALVTPQNWLFLTTYKKLRSLLLENETWNMVARLGARAFETITGEVVNVALLALTRQGPREDHMFAGIDASEPKAPAEKAALLKTAGAKLVEQARQLQNPDARVTEQDSDVQLWLNELADYGKGSTTGDSPRFLQFFWERPGLEGENVPWLNSPNKGGPWSGRSQVCVVGLDSRELTSQFGCWLRGQDVWKRPGVVVNKMRSLEPFLYSGEIFDDNVCPICPRSPEHVPAIWAYVASGEFHDNVRAVDQALKVTAGTLTKVPFDLARWQKVATEKYPHGLPEPYSNDPTQWIFHGHPRPCAYGPALEAPWPTPATLTVSRSQGISSDIDAGIILYGDKGRPAGNGRGDWTLQVAVTRLLGYRWPAESDDKMELSKEARAWIAESRKLDYYADADGIVCLPSVRGEEPAAGRLRALLAAAFGADWSPAIERELIVSTGSQAASLDEWLRESFFEQHCKLFRHRPFIWHVWDGRKHDGFQALVSYHRLAEMEGGGRRLLESLVYSYLGDWIKRQEDGVKRGENGADGRLAAALELQKKLAAILEGEPPFDLFVRWKPLSRQPIGWEPDLDDGVRVNIRPFMAADLPSGARGAGILRWKPNIKWGKDRGRESAKSRNNYPWFWDWDEKIVDFMGGKEFNSHRWNGCHYTNETKRLAREIHEEEQAHAEADRAGIAGRT